MYIKHEYDSEHSPTHMQFLTQHVRLQVNEPANISASTHCCQALLLSG